MSICHIKKIIALVATIACLPFVVNAEYFQWVDKNGVVRFGDSPTVDEQTSEEMDGIRQFGKDSVQLGGATESSKCENAMTAVCNRINNHTYQNKSDIRSAFNDLKNQCEPEPLVNAVFSTMREKIGTEAFHYLEDTLEEYVFGQPGTTRALIRGLGSDNKYIRHNAEKLLYLINHPDAIRPIVDALTVKPEDQRIILANSLQNYCSYLGNAPDVVPEIVEILDTESNMAVKRDLTEVLGWSDNPAALDILIRLMDYPDHLLQARAATSVVMIKKRSVYPPELEEKLITGLDLYGDPQMGSAFINDGNERLSKAAFKWADEHGYSVERLLSPGQGF